jgi:oxygen-independent coproporphyrinogen-3 oxidase
MTPYYYSLYFHIPFCVHRCAYCDFNTYAGQEGMIPAYVEALRREVDFVGHGLRITQLSNSSTTQLPNDPTTAHTIFFGGGTPSLLSPKQFDSILKSIRDHFTLTDDAEMTIEANPGTVSLAHLLDLRSIGINRISYGVQSANAEELRMLERAHNFFDVIEAVTSARKAGFDNLNLDLIYGLPEQTLSTWQTTVKRILDLHPEHISAYALTLEHGAPFGRWASRGMLPLPDPDLAADMYEWAGETLAANGYIQYEISNWARSKDEGGRQKAEAGRIKDELLKQENSSFVLHPSSLMPSFACRHNLQYWRGLPYLGFGAGGHGYANGFRYSNVLRIKTYLDRLTNYQSTDYPFPLSPATVNHHKQTLHDDMSEFMMTGLRLTRAGIRESEFQERFGQSLRHVYGKEIEDLLKLGLIEETPLQSGEGVEAGIRLSKRGRLLGNKVFIRFV